jgi:flagellar hook-basal body complex protein FliE
MSINSINPLIPNVQPIKSATQQTSKVEEGGAQSSFGDMLNNALKEVNDLQNEANDNIEGLTLKKEGVTPHSAMVALEKADVAFQLMNAIRGKIIRAYEEVIRTQV